MSEEVAFRGGPRPLNGRRPQRGKSSRCVFRGRRNVAVANCGFGNMNFVEEIVGCALVALIPMLRKFLARFSASLVGLAYAFQLNGRCDLSDISDCRPYFANSTATFCH